MERLIKRLIWAFTGLSAAILISFASSVSVGAVSSVGSFKIYGSEPGTNSSYLARLHNWNYGWERWVLEPKSGQEYFLFSNPKFHINSTSNFILPATAGGKYFTFSYTINIGGLTGASACPTSSTQVEVLDCQISVGGKNGTGTSGTDLTYSGGSITAVNITGRILPTASQFALGGVFISGGYQAISTIQITYSDVTLYDSLPASGQNADVSEQISEQTKLQQEQYAKEEQQRQEDEQKAQDSADSASSSSESSQTDADESSASLWQIINSLKDTIIHSEPGNCNISGNFGFFDAGSIDVCTGGAAVRPITTVIGTVMLLFFTFTSAITVCRRFLDLYNESLRS